MNTEKQATALALATTKAKAKFILATDGETLEAEDLIKQWEIGVEQKLYKLAIKDAYSELKQDRAVGRNFLVAAVERYLTQAQKTIKSLEDGVFPVIK